MSETQAEERPLVQRFDGKVATFKVTNIFFSMGICEGDFFCSVEHSFKVTAYIFLMPLVRKPYCV